MISTTVSVDCHLAQHKLDTVLDIESLPNDMFSLFPSSDIPQLCCCMLINPTFNLNDHLDDCEIKWLDIKSWNIDPSALATKEAQPLSPSSVDDHVLLKRRKHRESMARLRRGWRSSLCALRQEEKRLERVLREKIAAGSRPFNPQTSSGKEEKVMALYHTYVELVAEQMHLQDERTHLEMSCSLYDKFARLLEREVDQIRLFSVLPAPSSS